MSNDKTIAINSEAYKREIREVFALNDSRYQIEITIHRGFIYMESKKERKPTCGIYVRFVAVKPDPKTPNMRASAWWCANDTEPDVHLTMTHTGCQFSIEQVEVENIAKTERDRLHTFLSELRGVRYTFVQDMFGFLDKNGLDKKQVFELPFPLIAKKIASETNASQTR